MEFFQIVCLCAMAQCILSGGPPFQYLDNNQDAVVVDAGAKSFELVWETDSGAYPEYTLFEFKHQNPVTKAERLIGKVNDMTESEVATGYRLNVTKPEGSYKRLALVIDTVETRDDGMFIAIATSNADSSDMISVAKNVTVVKKLAKLHLQFDQRDPISSKPEDAVEVEAGSYPVKCIAEGSNPATKDVSLHLDGNPVSLEGSALEEAMDGDERQFKTTITGNVAISERTAVYEVECVATDQSGETLSTKLDLKVIVPEREDVKCEETKAKEGDMSVSLSCTVDNANMNITDMAFQVGKTMEIIKVGQDATNSSFVVTKTSSGSGKSTVVLTLAKAEDWHFESDFYLILTMGDGSQRKETLTLKKSDSDGDNGNCLTACLGWILFLAVTVLLIRH